MSTFIKIAWRNVWRNPRRSGVVIAAMAVGLWGMYFSLGFSHGMGVQMVENIVQSYLGELQIHDRNYPGRAEGAQLAKMTLENPIRDPEKVEKILESDPQVTAWAPRLKAMGLITNAEKTAGVAMLGVDPLREKNVTYIDENIIEGTNLRPGEMGDILIGAGLAKKLKVGVGSKVVIMAQDASKQKAVAAFHVIGIYNISSVEFEKVMIYINLDSLQKMLDMEGKINEIALLVNNPDGDLKPYQTSLQAKLGPDVEVLQWKEVFPFLAEIVALFDMFTFVFFILVFIAMAFGIANAVLMAVFERIHELGIMKAMGARPIEIFWTVAFESMGLSLMGVVAGTALGWATTYYFGRAGINLAMFSDMLDQMGLGAVVYTRMEFKFVWWGAITSFLTAFLSSLWPAIKAARLMPVDAITHI